MWLGLICQHGRHKLCSVAENATVTRPRNHRIKRNDPCYCGSGKKYKRCHGNLSSVATRPAPPPPEVQRMLEQHKAREMQREEQQGLGRPIIGTEFKGHQFVAVGNKLYYGKWKTFFDFLSHYIKVTLGSDWGNAEIAKPLEQRHPILQWYDAVCHYQQKTILEPGAVYSAPMSGATAAYYGIAYNLYLLAHNVELQGSLVRRLKNPDQFRGAYYETFVAGCFILAGFELSLENESDPNSTHCEFTAKSKLTGNSYSVEAKSRAPNKAHLDIGNQLYDALCKVANHPRIVLIDVNVPSDQANSEEKWLGELVPILKSRETTLKIKGEAAPSAFVIITNHPYHYDLEGTGTNRAVLADGFKIPDFGVRAQFTSLIDAFKAMQKHADLFRLIEAFRKYQIPSTFDGEIPEFAFGEAERHWVIGKQYDLLEYEHGAVGVLTTATVSESDKIAHLVFQLQDGRNVLTQAPMTDSELAAYRQHPDTFFGVHLHVGKEAKDPLALFEFFYENYKNTPRERMLEFLKSAHDFDSLSKLPDEELRLVFCDRHVGAVMQMSEKKRSDTSAT